MKVEFMIDTGCQVTILATSLFERMCADDPQVRSRLCPSVGFGRFVPVDCEGGTGVERNFSGTEL